MEMEHIVRKESLSINVIFLCEIYKSSLQAQFQWYTVIRRWQFSYFGMLENQQNHNQVYSTSWISYSRIHTHLLHRKKKWPIWYFSSQHEHIGEFLICISKIFLLQFMILCIIFTGIFVVSSFVNRWRVSKIHQSILFRKYQNLHVAFSISIHA